MNKQFHSHTKELRRVGDFSQKAFMIIMGLLLALTCVPILPGNVEEAHAEIGGPLVTQPTETYYAVHSNETVVWLNYQLFGGVVASNTPSFGVARLYVNTSNTPSGALADWYDSSGTLMTTPPDLTGATVTTTRVGTTTHTPFLPKMGTLDFCRDAIDVFYQGTWPEALGSTVSVMSPASTACSWSYSFNMGDIHVNTVDPGPFVSIYPQEMLNVEVTQYGGAGNIYNYQANYSNNVGGAYSDVVYRYQVTPPPKPGSVPPTVNAQDY